MVELLRTNNPVELGWAQMILESAGIAAQVFDLNINFLEGNIGAFPRRLMVSEGERFRAEAVLREARESLDGIEGEGV
ncbi:MAG: DUF2007 domain-containing protein [Magnetococcales bacterium]|nr:DUF2007 domain-containing protein [Magnetococcales bacterium]